MTFKPKPLCIFSKTIAILFLCFMFLSVLSIMYGFSIEPQFKQEIISESRLNNRITNPEKTYEATLLDKQLPMDLASCAVASNGSHCFLLGGTNSSWYSQNAIYIVDLQTFHSTNLTKERGISLSKRKYDMAYIQIRNKLYMFGGVDEGIKSDSICCFNVDTLEFECVDSTLPYGITRLQVMKFNQYIYLIGGIDHNSDYNRAIYKYNYNKDILKVINEELPQNIGFVGVKTLNETHNLLLGGYNVNSGTRSNLMWLFSLKEEKIYPIAKTLPYNLVLLDQFTCCFEKKPYILLMDYANDTGKYTQPIHIDKKTFDCTLETSNLTTPVIHQFMVTKSIYGEYLVLGGKINDNYWSSSYIFKLRQENQPEDILFRESFQSNQWLLHNEAAFGFENQCMNWHINKTPTEATHDFEHTTKIGDKLELEVGYENHSDVNTRTRIFTGFTDSNSFNATQHPGNNYIGITVINNDVYGVNFRVQIVKNDQQQLDNYFYQPQNQSHSFSLQTWIKNTTHFYLHINIDGLVAKSSYVRGNLTGIAFKKLAVWNQKFLDSVEAQGDYNGSLLHCCYKENVNRPLDENWYFLKPPFVNKNQTFILDQNVILLILILLTIVSLIGLIATRNKINNLFEKPSDVGLPEAIVPSTIYRLYLELKRPFERLKQISYEIEETESVIDINNKLFTEFSFFKQDIQQEPINLQNLTDLSSIALKILIYLLDYLDRGTYFSAIRVDLDLNRGTLSYNLDKLEEKGLISRDEPELHQDQRYKIISISEKGFSILYQIYIRLEAYFNNKRRL